MASSTASDSCCFGRIDSLWLFYATFLVISIGSSGCNPIVMYIGAAQWFRRKRGRAMALIASGSAFSGIMVYLLVVLINAYGWRNTVFVLAIASWVVVLPLSSSSAIDPSSTASHPTANL